MFFQLDSLADGVGTLQLARRCVGRGVLQRRAQCICWGKLYPLGSLTKRARQLRWLNVNGPLLADRYVCLPLAVW